MNAFDPAEVEEVARELAVRPGLVEKEWHAVEIVRIVSATAHPTCDPVFSGGTSLAAAMELVRRFSEDVDFKLRPKRQLSKEAHQQAVREFASLVREAVTKEGYDEDPSVAHEDERFGFHRIAFRYPPKFAPSRGFRPHVQVELTPDNSEQGPSPFDVHSAVSRLLKRPPHRAGVRCLDLVETGADKLSALTWRVLDRDREAKNDDPTMVRHIFDLAALAPRLVGIGRFRHLCIAKLRTDADRGREGRRINRAFPQESVLQARRMLEMDKNYKTEYGDFVAGMVYGRDPPPPDLEEALRKIDDIIADIGR